MKLPNSWVNRSMASSERPGRGRQKTKRGAGQQIVEGRNFRLADEVRYIQRRATNRDGRVVAFGELLLFSTDTGDAWLLDRSDRLATRLARDGEAEEVHIEDTIPCLLSAGRDTIASTGRRSSTRIARAAGPSPSSGTPPIRSRKQ